MQNTGVNVKFWQKNENLSERKCYNVTKVLKILDRLLLAAVLYGTCTVVSCQQDAWVRSLQKNHSPLHVAEHSMLRNTLQLFVTVNLFRTPSRGKFSPKRDIALSDSTRWTYYKAMHATHYIHRGGSPGRPTGRGWKQDGLPDSTNCTWPPALPGFTCNLSRANSIGL